MVMKSAIFVRHLSLHLNLNTTFVLTVMEQLTISRQEILSTPIMHDIHAIEMRFNNCLTQCLTVVTLLAFVGISRI